MAIVLTTDDTRREVFLKAEQAKIHTGSALPELDNPASIGDVIAGKEYIDGAGAKQTGALVICDTVAVVESVGSSGVGVNVEIESTADGSTKMLTLPEPNLKTENIKNGVSIFGIAGSAKTMRVETGTITPAEDSASLALPCTANPKMFVVQATDAAMNNIIADNVAAMVSAAGCWKTFKIGQDGAYKDNNLAAATIHLASSRMVFGSVICNVPTYVTVGAYSVYRWKAGMEYQWTAYYWEDNA